MELTKQEIKNLKDKKFRKENSLFIVEGDKFCKDLLNSNIEIIKTITTNKNLKDFPNICNVSEKVLNSLATTKTPQTIICVCKIKKHSIKSVGNSLVLDNLQDPGNVGTLIRSAVAFNFFDIYLIGGADPYSEKVIRSSAGTILRANLHLLDFETFNSNLSNIADNFLVADMCGETINKIHLPKNRIAVIIGNEGNGVGAELRSVATHTVSIPMNSAVESLNAGVAGSIIMQKIGEIK